MGREVNEGLDYYFDQFSKFVRGGCFEDESERGPLVGWFDCWCDC